MVIYYDSKTGNVARFVEKVSKLVDWDFVKVATAGEISAMGHLLTYTTKMGQVPDSTLAFMAKNHLYITSVSSSGNRNWGNNFALAANKIAKMYGIPIVLKFELAGLESDVTQFVTSIKEYGNKEMDTPQQ